ncbi:MAG: DNA primase [Dehalococcoidales bacterium]
MSVIEEVKQRTDIVDVVSQYVALKKAGRNLTGLCPFHSEKNPSFFVYLEQQSWHCFGCNTGGDVLSFVMKKESMDFGETLHLLAQKAGVTIPSKYEREEGRGEKERLYQVNEAAAQYFHDLLLNSPASEKARGYITRRGFSAATIADFQLGFSLKSWNSLKQYLLERGYTENELLNAGLMVEAESGKTHDRFRDKLMFPIMDIKKHVIGFGARVLDDSLPKYVNSPQTPVFDKSGSLYGINLAAASIRQQETAVVVEGYMDTITAHQNGFNNVVASMGTSVTERQIDLLKKRVRTMIIALDSDTAGKEAMLLVEKTSTQAIGKDFPAVQRRDPKLTLQPLNEIQVRHDQNHPMIVTYAGIPDIEVKVLILPDGKDPDDVIRDNADNWRRLLDESLPIMDYTFNMVTAELDLATARDKSLAVQRLGPIIKEMKDNVRKAHYLQKLAGLVDISERELEAELSRIGPSPDRRRSRVPIQEAVRPATRPVLSSPLEEDCLALLLQHPELKSNNEDLPPEYFENSENRELFLAWYQANDLQSLKKRLDTAIQEHFDSLVNRSLPSNQMEQRYADYVRRLKERYLKRQEARRAEKFALEAESKGPGADRAMLEEEGMETAIQLREIYTQKGQRRSEIRS